jgi:CO/xanthine dehydrogenase Mo-binding subunit
VGVFDIGTVVNAKTAASQLRGGVGITGVAAGVANAVHHATGKRIRTLPSTLDAVLL